MRTLSAVLPAFAILIAVTAALVLADAATLGLVADRYAFVVYGAGGLLAAVFHRSRVVIASAGLLYLDRLRGAALPEGGFVAFATALLVLLGALALLRDRGVRSRVGLAQVGIGAGALVVVHQLVRDPVAASELAALRLLPLGASEALGVPDVTLVVAAVAMLLATLGAVRWRGPVERALLGAQALVLAAAHPALSSGASSILLMGAGTLLALSVVEQSYSMAYRDELTRLPGRRALMRDLGDMAPPFTVAMVDVDHFKKFNDTHGHDVGDQVLQLVASRLAGAAGANAYRYGGEEFTLVFPRRTRADSEAGAEAVRASVEEAEFSLRAWNRPRKRPADGTKKKKKTRKRPRTLSVTVSIGLADSGTGDASPEVVLKKADQALYRAKEQGRNRVAT
ncbi:MAG: diguanylate cyclase [Gemmatimonadales bacterium]